MAQKKIAWSTGTGYLTFSHDGGSAGTTVVTITSDANNLTTARSMDIVLQTTDGAARVTLRVTQEAASAQTANFQTSEGLYLELVNGDMFNSND